MNPPILAASALMAITTAVHVFSGGPEIHVPIQASSLSADLRAISAVIWHAITVILAGFAVALVWLSLKRNEPLAWLIIGVQLGFAALFIFYGLTMLDSLWPMPQWIVFLIIPTIMLWGMRRQRAL